MLLQTTCPLCEEPGPAPCLACRAMLPAAGAPAVPSGLDGCVSLVDYAGAGRRLVTSLKYANRRAAVPWIGAALAAGLPGPAPDLITWAPTSAVRARGRGFDQARLIARSIAPALRVSARRTLARLAGGPQTGARRSERLGRPAFRPVRRVPARIGLVDDVLTTGATMSAAAAALRTAGALQVVGFVVAVTPSDPQEMPDDGRRIS